MKTIKDTQTVTDTIEDKDKTIPTTKRAGATYAKSHSITQKVLSLVSKYRKDIDEPDLPKVQAEMKAFFNAQPKQPYYLMMDKRFEKEDKRLVIIGDTHCDYNSLAAIFEKLALSCYNYFDNATFIFLGDYLDRGNILFEYLMLLIGFKKLLGNRCIFLKGNHELIEYDRHLKQLESMVYPSDSCPTLNKYCGTDKEFLEKFADYFSNLPYYILLKTNKGTDLLVHGGIPRDEYLDKCTITHDTGEMMVTGDEHIKESILDNMIWSDPRADKIKLQGASSRFEFGQEQFQKFMFSNKIDRLLRSHEPVQNGVKTFYDDHLFTIFSNGGEGNTITGYPNVENPVFGIMGIDGEIRFESIHFKKATLKNGFTSISTLLYMGKEANPDFEFRLDDLHLNNEFFVINQ